MSNAPLRWKENTLHNAVTKVLDRVCNVFLLDDLRSVEMDFINNMYPIVTVLGVVNRAVREHLHKCTMHLRVSSMNVYLSSLGCLRMRRKILGVYVDKSQPVPKVSRRMFKIGIGKSCEPRQRVYNKAIPYVSC